MIINELFKLINQNQAFKIPVGWVQGRTVYGGLVAGLLMYKAKQCLSSPNQPAVSASISLVGPVDETKAVELSAEVLRQGKSVISVEVRLWQDEAVKSVMLVSFANARPSSIRYKNYPKMPNYAKPEMDKVVSSSLFPQCYQNFNLQWVEGNYPCSASEKPDFGGWFQYHAAHEVEQIDESLLLTLIDIWPPGVLPMFDRIAPASSLTWHVSFINPIQAKNQDWLCYQVQTDFAEAGYATSQAHIWNNEGQLLAISRQTVAIFL